MIKLIPLLLLCICQSGCATKIHHYKAYDETHINLKSLSKLHVPGDILVNTINGKGRYNPSYVSDVSPYSGAVIEIMPGVHSLNVEYYYRNVARQKGSTNLSFLFEPGKSYFIYEQHKFINDRPYVHFDFYECGSQKEIELNLSRKKATDNSWLFTYPPLCGTN